MYPYLHDLINDLLGTNLRLPFPMFGFWVAMAFIGAHYVFSSELKRKEGLGLVNSIRKSRVIGEKMKSTDYLSSGLIGFVLGFKLLHAVTNYAEFVNNPPGFIFSTEGNWLGGIAVGAIMIYLKKREVDKQVLPEPKTITEDVHPYELVGNMTLIAAISGILGAKLFHNLENIEEFMAAPLDALVSFSGLSIFGGLIAGGFAVTWYVRKNNIPFWHAADSVAPGLMLAYGIGRIGCQMAGDGDWGIPNDAPMPDFLTFLPEWVWAYDYPNNVLGIDLQKDFERMGMVSLTGKAWPTPLYESVSSLLMFSLLWIFRNRMIIPGTMFTIYLMMTGFERFFIEKIRINPPYHFLGIEATQAEIISLVLFTAGVLGLIYVMRNNRDNELSTN